MLTCLGVAATGCSDDESNPGEPHHDAGATYDAAPGPSDAGDAGRRDAGPSDAGLADAAEIDASDGGPPRDAANRDALADADTVDAAEDASAADAGEDAGEMDASAADSGPAEAGGGGSDAAGDDAALDADVPEGGAGQESFALRVVALGLEAPWEITWGVDDRLWVTERVGKRVLRVEPATGAITIALTLSDAHQSGGQDGVLGLVLDPRFGQGSGDDYVYIAYTYDADPGEALQRQARIARYTYDPDAERLISGLELLGGLPASNDHNSGRLRYGPDDHLYYTIGDQGNNQFDRKCLPIRAQQLPTQSEVDQRDWSAYQGKVLRIARDGSIPSDNPSLAGVRSHIYSYGHRNAQGIVFGPDGKLYVDEHGPKTDDELNLITAGSNYGWPHVAGYRDDRAYVYGNWSASSGVPCEQLAFSDYVLPPSVPQQRESDWTPDFVPPLLTFYTVDDDYNFMDPACAGNEYICWPTIAPSSLDVYQAGEEVLQTWGTSLLLTGLKTGSVFRVQLNASGEATVGAPEELFKTTNRYRDLTVAPDKRRFYIVTDSEGATSGPTGGSTPQLDHRGAILEFRLVEGG